MADNFGTILDGTDLGPMDWLRIEHHYVALSCRASVRYYLASMREAERMAAVLPDAAEAYYDRAGRDRGYAFLAAERAEAYAAMARGEQ